MRLTVSRAGLLAFTSVLAVTTPMFSRTYQNGIEKQESLSGDSIQEKVRRILGQDLEEENVVRELFALGDEAVPSLTEFLSDADKIRRAGAARGLAFIENQQGMQALRNAVKAEKDKETKSAMSCFLAGGLVETKSENDLEFLRMSVERARLSADDDGRAFTGVCAALTLGMMGRHDSLPLLRKVATADLIDSEEIGKAIRWMENKTEPRQATTGQSLSDEELIKSAVLDGTFFAEAERDKTSVTQITFNREWNKALVSLEISLSMRSARGYDLVLAKENGVWGVVGIWFAWIA